MSALSSKQRDEQAAFTRFIKRRGSEGEWAGISSRPEPEPDLLCIHMRHGPIAFELVSLTDPTIAKIQAAGEKARQGAFSTADPSEEIIRNKLSKNYDTTARHIELLVYTDGQIVTPDDVIIPTIRPLFDALSHPFEQAWFMGEHETCHLWSAG